MTKATRMGTKRMRVTRTQILIRTKSDTGLSVFWEIVCMIPANGGLQGTVDQHYLLGALGIIDPVIKELVKTFNTSFTQSSWTGYSNLLSET